jgi:hypothetical protein
LSIKGLAGLPTKKAKFKIYINQQLAIAMGLVAGALSIKLHCRTAPQILCISEAATNYFLWGNERLRA